MTTRTNLKAGGKDLNHNETMSGGLKLNTHIKAGGQTKLALNHNESLRFGLATKTAVKAGRRA